MNIIMGAHGIWHILFLNLMGLGIVLGGQSSSRSKSTEISITYTSFQLPPYTRPIEYWLEINPLISTGSYKGEVKIRILAQADTREIILHSEDLEIKNVSVQKADEDEKKIESFYNTYPGRSTLEIRFNETIEGTYDVIITFEGALEKKHPFGFALHTGAEKQYNVSGTLFEPIFARRAFPCYDEPRFRTPFTLTVLKRPSENVRSISHSNPSDGTSARQNRDSKISITFAKTDPIPTHMLSYAIFDNQGYVENSHGGAYTIWTRGNARNQVSYAFETIAAVVEEMIDFTNVGSPSPVMDFIAMPGDMDGHGDESRWGSLLHAEKNILCDVNECSQAYQQRVTTSLARQVAYEWFGKYVSIESYNFLWLKHGFARFFSYEIFDEINPSLELSDFHGSVRMQTTLFDDINNFKEPLTRTGDLSTRVIVEMYKHWSFGTLSNKGSLILRMLQHIVGKNTFKRAIQRFLDVSRVKLQGLITPELLWKAFDTQLKVDERVLPVLPGSSPRQTQSISSVMEPFTTRAGYPVIIATRAPDHGIDFNLHNYVDKEEHLKLPWFVPITITTRSELNFQTTSPLVWASENTTTFLGMSIKPDEWYIVNVRNTAYCRVHYTDNNWKLLIKQLHDDPTKIHRLNRAQLLADSHQLAFDGQISFYIPIILSSYLYKETDPMVWMTALRSFKRFYTTISEKIRPLYQEHFVKCLRHEYERTGFEPKTGDTRATKMWRSEMLAFLCWIGHKGCIEKAKNEYQKHKSDLTKVNADLQHVVWCTMLRINSKALNSTAFTRSLKNMLCRKKVFDAASYCSLSPMENKDGFVYTYDTLSSDLLSKKEDDLCTAVFEMTKYHWDSVAAFLKMVEKEITKFRNQGTLLNSETKIKKLTKLMHCLRGLISGRAESSAIDRIYRMAVFLEEYVYTELVKSIRDARSCASAGGIKPQEDLLETILRLPGCPEVGSDHSKTGKDARSSIEIALNFFDENLSVEPVKNSEIEEDII